jgi:DNA-binding MarR family transcriptional regulator
VGLVEREPDAADGRGVVVRYTPRGLAALQVARTRGKQLERRFASHIGADRWRTVRDGLEALFDVEGTSQPHR